MATVTVGPDGQFTTIAAAVEAANPGDTVSVRAGNYINDFLDFNKDLTLQADGGQVVMTATTSPPDGKAMITESGNVTISGFDVSGVTVPDQNGAAVRYQGGNLTIANSYFHGNQDGLLGAPDPTGSITVDHSEFGFNGGGTGNTHNIYVGEIASFTATNSYFHDASVGHEIKSRAANNEITGNRILDNDSTSSYSIDLPSSGNARIAGNVIEQGPNGQNSYIIAYGEENRDNSGTSVSIQDNTIVNDRGSGTVLLNGTTVSPAFVNNSLWGLDADHLGGPLTPSGTQFLAARPTVDTSPLSFAVGTPTPTPEPPPPTPTPDPTPTPTPAPTPTPTPIPTPTPTPTPPPTPGPGNSIFGHSHHSPAAANFLAYMQAHQTELGQAASTPALTSFLNAFHASDVFPSQ
jgi:hypothetical protein